MSPQLQQVTRQFHKSLAIVGLFVGALLCGHGCDCVPARPTINPIPLPPIIPSTEDSDGAQYRLRKQYKKTARIHLLNSPFVLDPLHPKAATATEWLIGSVYDTLFTYRADGTQVTLAPNIVKTYEISADGLQITLHLKEGLFFHNGEPLEAKDVAYSIATAKKNGFLSSGWFSRMRQVEATAAHTVRVAMTEPDGYFLRLLAVVPIVSQQDHRKYFATKFRGKYRTAFRKKSLSGLDPLGGGHRAGKNDTGNSTEPLRRPPFGSGPYAFVSETSDTVLFSKSVSTLPTEVSSLELVIEPDLRAVLGAAQRLLLDYIPTVDSRLYPDEVSAPRIASEFTLFQRVIPSVQMLVVNCEKEYFRDPRVRQGISRLVKRQKLVQQHNDFFRAGSSLVWPGGPGHGVSPSWPEYNPQAARKLLASAGWRDDDSDGKSEYFGERMQLTFVTADAQTEDTLLVIDFLRKAGFRLDVVTLQGKALRTAIKKRNFDAMVITWSGIPDRDLGAVVGTDGEYAFGRCYDKRIDEALNDIRSEYDPNKRAKLLTKLGQDLVLFMPVIPLGSPSPYALISKSFHAAKLTHWPTFPTMTLGSTPHP